MTLQKLALKIFELCQQNRIQLFVQWIPRALNTAADTLSRIVDVDDLVVSSSVFTYLEHQWGPHSVDRFASHCCTHLPRFNSRWWNPGCEAVDAFTCEWRSDNNWCVPPMYLLGRLYHFLHSTPCHATVCLPEWLSAPWWPLWHPHSDWCSLVMDVILFPPGDNFAQHVTHLPCIFGPQRSSFNVFFVRVCSKGCFTQQFDPR